MTLQSAELSLGRTRVKLLSRPIAEAIESSVAFIEGPAPAGKALCAQYASPEDIEPILAKTIEAGLRTLAIGLPDSYLESLRIIRAVEAYLLVNGRQFLYLAFYGNSGLVRKLCALYSIKEDRILPLFLGKSPSTFQPAAPHPTIASLRTAFTDTPFILPAIQVRVELAEEQTLLHSAFKEYMTLMRTKKVSEFRRLYRSIPESKAVASFSCNSADGERVRLLLFDSHITQAGMGSFLTLSNCFFALTDFLSDLPQPTLFVGSGSIRFFSPGEATG